MLGIFDDLSNCIKPYFRPRLKLFKNLIGLRTIDALLHMPSYVIEKYYITEITDNFLEKLVTINIIIDCVELHYNYPSRPCKIYGMCGKSPVEIVLFNYNKNYVKSVYPVGKNICISGKLQMSENGHFKFVNPEKVISSKLSSFKGLFNIYPLTTGLSQGSIYSVVKSAFKILEENTISEWLPENIIKQNSFKSFSESLKDIHFPNKIYKNRFDEPAYKRLVFDELLAEQLVIRLASPKSKNGNIISNEKTLINKLIKKLPFELTDSQKQVLDEIFSDMEKNKPMTRLLQGDVGSGKTIVALMSILYAIESGYQCAVLAPTEMLARQHFKSMRNYFDELGLNIEILTSNEKGKKRQEILNNIKNGNCNLLVGTHAIITDNVEFNNLGLVVIDEQHRFGVNQRLSLIEKGVSPHVLSMTATPIPRTIIMSLYGDIDVSSIKEKPKGRKEIVTKAVPKSRINDIVTSINNIIQNNQRVYWICPLVEESEKLKYTCVINRYEYLKKYFPENVLMLHGKMKSSEKQEIFEKFEQGKCKILVSTTVIEVGVDVPEATAIIIENAEKFGLAQLHQLRGRVGRSDLQSFCILLFEDKISHIARERIQTIRDSNDGFEIAEKDLLLRGGGEIIGTKQSGEKSYKTFDMKDPAIQYDIYNLLKQASCLATEIILDNQIHNFKTLLKIFKPENFENIKLSF